MPHAQLAITIDTIPAVSPTVWLYIGYYVLLHPAVVSLPSSLRLSPCLLSTTLSRDFGLEDGVYVM